MDPKELVKLGLSEAEATIYYSIIKQGICTVKDVAKDCGFHRTNIYDIMEQLIEKGLITYFREGKTTKYQVSDPKNLYSFLEESRSVLDRVFPELEKLHEEKYEGFSVEVYKEENGMKATFKDMIKEGKPIYTFGVKGQLREKLPAFGAQFIRDMKNKKIKYTGIYTKKVPPGYGEIRYLPEEMSGPVATFIYSDKININIWEPTLVAIVIKSKLVAEMYKKHFDLLWKIAKVV